MHPRKAMAFAVLIFCFPAMAADKRLNQAIEFMKTACAASEKVEIKVDGDGGLSLLKRGVEGRVHFSKSDARGVAEGLTGEIQGKNLDGVRECMKPYIAVILGTILGNERESPGSVRPQISTPGLLPKKPSEILSSVEIGMSFGQIVSLLGEPDEVENSYFIGSDADAMRYGSYWLISRRGKLLDCIISQRAIDRVCSRLGGGCESRSCDWYRKNAAPHIVKQ